MPQNPRLVVLGGGTGTFTILQSLKELTPDIAAVVNMSDDGGSTGVLRDELGVLPPGDARQCLVALSEAPELRDLFSYRFNDGRLEGQSLGNIILSGLELQHGSFEKSIDIASRILRIRGEVVPIALGAHHLVMKDGSDEIFGQFAIKTHPIVDIHAHVRIEPAGIIINPRADEVIRTADVIIIAPGDLYSSLLPIFSVHGVSEALAATKAHVVMMSNLVNKFRQTDDWHVVDYVRKLEEYIGEGVIDTVLYNNEPISDELLQKYAADGEFPVGAKKARFKELNTTAVGMSLVSKEIYIQNPADKKVRRTLIRHDPIRAKAEIVKIIEKIEKL